MPRLHLLIHFHVLLVVYGQIIIQNDQVNISFSITLYNNCQTDFNRLQIYQDTSMFACVTECGLRNHCEALNYHEHMNLCELFTEGGTKVSRKNCFHVKQSDIKVIQTPCDTVCEEGKTCDIETRKCVFTECIEFPEVQNGLILGNSKNVGHKILTKCHRHYQPKDNINLSYCMNNGQWSPLVVCIRDCEELTLPSGTMIQQQNGTNPGSVIMYACEPGFVLAGGSLIRTCSKDGIWSGEAPQCDVIDCGELIVPTNTIIQQQNGTTIGSIIEYACQPESNLVNGSLMRTCGEDGIWSGEEPACSNCTSSGICYVKFLNTDLLGYDMASTFVTPFEECSEFCEINAPGYKSIEHCTTYIPWGINCYCKDVSDLELLNALYYLNGCSYYRKL